MTRAGSCLVCGAGGLKEIPAFAGFAGVGSDCRPWPRAGRLAVCRADGTVQKVTDARWRADAEAIYRDYALYHQSTARTEILVFEQEGGSGATRSRRVLDYLGSRVDLTPRGRLLDVGCGRGTTLRAFAELGLDWTLEGLDPHLRNADEVAAIPGVVAVHDGRLDGIRGTFGLISVIHTLEHVDDPRGFLDAVRVRLGEAGILLVQVPYFPDNPFDLLVADHCLHFTAGGLAGLLAGCGFEVFALSTAAVPRELTVLARPAANPPSPAKAQSTGAAVDACAVWLGAVLETAREVEKEGNLGIFGTGIAANWLIAEMDDHIAFFVDEDTTRAGTVYRGRPVHHPDEAPADGHVFVALPPAVANPIAERLAPAPATCHLPPPLPILLDESLA